MKILGETKLILISPNLGINYLSTEKFNITVYFNDTIKNIGISGALIERDINNTGFASKNYYDYGNGTYDITIFNWQVRKIGFGLIIISINASLAYFNNQTTNYNYYLYNATMQTIDSNFLNVVRSNNITFTIHYLWNNSNPIAGASLQVTSIDPSFNYFGKDLGAGAYQLELDTNNVEGKSTAYQITLIIFSSYNESQSYDLFLYVWNRTSYAINGLNETIYLHSLNAAPWWIYYGEDVTFNISYIDLDNNNKLITNAWANLTIYNSTISLPSVVITIDKNGYYIVTLDTDKLFIGAYNVKILLNRTYYNSSIGTIQLNIISVNTSMNLINLTQYGQTVFFKNNIFEAFQGENITVFTNFMNYYTNELILGAEGHLIFNGVDYYDYDTDKDGVYFWEINTSEIIHSVGHNFTVIFTKNNYQLNSTVWFFDINIIQTNITIDLVFDGSGPLGFVELNDYRTYTSKGITNVTVIITYWDINHSIPIDTIRTGNLTVTRMGTFVEQLFNETDLLGQAWFTLDSSNYLQETKYMINITFWEINYYPAFYSFNLTLVKWDTNATIIAVNQTGGLTKVVISGIKYIVYRNYNTTFLVQYQNAENGSFIKNALVLFTFTNYTGIPPTYVNSKLTNSSGRCLFNIPTTNMNVGIFEFTITFSKEDHITRIITGLLRIRYIPTNGSETRITQISHGTGIRTDLIYYIGNDTYKGTMLYNIMINFSYGDELNKEWINDATMKLIFQGTNYFDYSGFNGIYSIIIPTANLNGTYLIQITMYKVNWENITRNFFITIVPLPTELLLADLTPDKSNIYTSRDIFNITIFYNDTIKGIGLSGAKFYYIINDSITTTQFVTNGTAGYYYLQINCSKFLNWGKITIIITGTKFGYKNSTLIYNFIVNGESKLNIINPILGLNYLSTEKFNITVYFNDTIKKIGISGAEIWYSILGTPYQTSNWYDYGNGTYEITIFNWQVRKIAFGPISITINISKQYYVNQSKLFTYFLYNATIQSINKNILNVIRGNNITFTVNYMWNNSNPIIGANLQYISIDASFSYWLKDNHDGSYDLILNTSSVLGKGSTPYTIVFNISSSFNQTQEYTVFLVVWNRTTYIVNGLQQITYPHSLINAPWFIYYGDDVVFNISYIDIDNGGIAIPGAFGNITLYNMSGVLDFNQVFVDINGYYFFTLDTDKLFTGIYFIDISFNKTYFNKTVGTFQLEIIPCNISTHLINFSQNSKIVINPQFGTNFTVTLNLTNLYSNALILGAFANLTFNGTSYIYTDLDQDGIYTFENINSYLLPIGTYSFIITFIKNNYQNDSFEIFFNITQITLNVSLVNPPDQVKTGETFDLTFNVTNSITDAPIAGILIQIFIDFGEGYSFTDNKKTANEGLKTSATGLVTFSNILIPDTATKVNISVSCLGNATINNFNFNFMITLEISESGDDDDSTEEEKPKLLDMMFFFLIIIGIAIGASIVIVIAKIKGKEKEPEEKLEKKKIVEKPKKIIIEEKKKLMQELETDAIAAIKKGNYNIASQKYQAASIIASEIMSLGDNSVISDFNRFSDKSKEYKRKSEPKRTVKVKTVVIEQDEVKPKELFKPPVTPKSRGFEAIPVKIRDHIEGIILKLLYKEKSIKTQKILIDKVLEIAVAEKITISEKNVKLILNRMAKDKKIAFNQKEGWKIQI
ncbi:MAG: hypothetical protein ACTSPD_16910 [Promethearchaeota archaeon]